MDPLRATDTPPEGSFPLADLCGRALEPEAFLKLVIGITEALGALHSRNIIHRSLTPHTIFIAPDTGSVTLVLPPHPGLPQQDPAYISPEATGRINRTP